MKINGKNIDKNIKGIIFDCDGTIMNSEPLHLKAYQVIAKKYGTTYSAEDHCRFVGTSDGMVAKDMITRIKGHPQLTWKDLVKQKQKHFFEKIPTIKPRDGMVEFIKNAKDAGFKIAVASSSTIVEVEEMLKAGNVLSYFPVVIGGNQVKKKKPDPEIYLKSAQALGLKPEECMALEDSPVGAEAAVRAGMVSIAWPHEYTKKKTFVDGAYKIESLDEIEP